MAGTSPTTRGRYSLISLCRVACTGIGDVIRILANRKFLMHSIHKVVVTFKLRALNMSCGVPVLVRGMADGVSQSTPFHYNGLYLEILLGPCRVALVIN